MFSSNRRSKRHLAFQSLDRRQLMAGDAFHAVEVDTVGPDKTKLESTPIEVGLVDDHATEAVSLDVEGRVEMSPDSDPHGSVVSSSESGPDQPTYDPDSGLSKPETGRVGTGEPTDLPSYEDDLAKLLSIELANKLGKSSWEKAGVDKIFTASGNNTAWPANVHEARNFNGSSTKPTASDSTTVGGGGDAEDDAADEDSSGDGDGQIDQESTPNPMDNLGRADAGIDAIVADVAHARGSVATPANPCGGPQLTAETIAAFDRAVADRQNWAIDYGDQTGGGDSGLAVRRSVTPLEVVGDPGSPAGPSGVDERSS
jgi:hypothetical protein